MPTNCCPRTRTDGDLEIRAQNSRLPFRHRSSLRLRAPSSFALHVTFSADFESTPPHAPSLALLQNESQLMMVMFLETILKASYFYLNHSVT